MSMFVYFGAKGRIAHKYPRPEHDTIIEPFAGSAGYSLFSDHWTRNVVLVEKHPDIAALWGWLIDEATPEAIMGLPPMTQGQSLDDYGKPGGPIRTLAALGAGSNAFLAIQTASEWMAAGWQPQLQRVSRQLHKVKHWQVVNDDYANAPDVAATWFIDPPYQKIKLGYNTDRRTIDFDALGRWCRTRQGQVMVCEESGADWLPFEPLTAQRTIDGTDTLEMVWYNRKRSDVLF